MIPLPELPPSLLWLADLCWTSAGIGMAAIMVRCVLWAVRPQRRA